MKRTPKIMVAVVAALLLLGSAAFAAKWYVPGDFATIQEAIDSASVAAGDKILVGPGSFAGATVTKAVEIKGIGGAVINSGPFPWPNTYPFMAGFFFPGEDVGKGATISHFRFEGVEFPVYSRGADDITVTHCTMINPIQGVSNWGGCGWQISHNEIIDLCTSCGGGIGILIADRSARANGIQDNIITHNKITGTIHVPEDDCGGYSGPGIALFADFRWGLPGATAIVYNQVMKNKVALSSDHPELVEVAAIELSDTRDDPLILIIQHNKISFNEFRDTATSTPILLTPENLDTVNAITRNLGENRGHGLHPKAFAPEP